jgi:hypothetical protein
MSVWFSAEGELKVRASDEAERIVDDELQYGEVYAVYEDNGDGTATVSVQGGDSLSNSSPQAFEESLAKLKEFVLESSFVETECDGEKSHIYIGDPDKRAEAVSDHTLNLIEQLVQHLTESDKNKLKGML